MKTFITILFLVLGLSQALRYPSKNLSQTGDLHYYNKYLKHEVNSAAAKHEAKLVNDLKNVKLPKEHHHKEAKKPEPTKTPGEVDPPTSFDARQKLRDVAHSLRHKIRAVKHENHEDNVKEEQHILQLEAARDDYIANHHSGDTQITDRVEQIKYQINHDEKFREKYAERAAKETKLAAEATSKADKERHLKRANFDKGREAHFAAEAKGKFQELTNFQTTKLGNEQRMDNTVHKMNHNIHKAEVGAFKVRQEGDDKVKPLEKKEKNVDHALEAGKLAKEHGINDRNMEKVNKEAIEGAKAASEEAKESAKAEAHEAKAMSKISHAHK